jgi:hypothetical protein
LADCYEKLRDGALDRASMGDHFGRIVLLREGVAAWMALASVPPTLSRPVANDRPAVAPLVPDELRNDIALVLASMVMTTREERCA